MDDALEQFTGITGSNPTQASQYLRVTDGNLEQAIQLFFESGGIDLEDNSQPGGPAEGHVEARQSPANTGRADRHGVIHLDSDDETMDEDARMAHELGSTAATTGDGSNAVEDDEAMARRLQEELYTGGHQQENFNADGVRAPMARTTETLVGPEANWGANNSMDAAIEEQLAARRRPGEILEKRFNQ
jgi:hypothetical protein